MQNPSCLDQVTEKDIEKEEEKRKKEKKNKQMVGCQDPKQQKW